MKMKLIMAFGQKLNVEGAENLILSGDNDDDGGGDEDEVDHDLCLETKCRRN